MSPSSGHASRGVVRQLVRTLALALAFVLSVVSAGALVGPWTAPVVPHSGDDQVLAAASHEVLATESHESQPPLESEDDEDTVVSHIPLPDAVWTLARNSLRAHDALGPPNHVADVETPPPRA